jgi:hypothetical protein
MATRQCVVDGCGRRSSYHMSWRDAHDTNHAGRVCATHDRSLGRQNLYEWKPWMERQTIVDWDNKFCSGLDRVDLEQYVFSIDPGEDR